MLKHIVAALVLSVPVVAFGATHEINANCGQTVRAFFAPLIQQNLINPKPAHVAPSSVNSFNPRILKPLTAFGFRVTKVIGYSDDPLLFVSNGAPSQDVYGVVLHDGIGNVQAQLNSLGVTQARVMRIEEKETLVLCKGEK